MFFRKQKIKQEKDEIISIAKPNITDLEIKAVIKVLKSDYIAQAKNVELFEKEFSNYVNTKYTIALNNGTSALHTALHALNIKKNDEVITTPLTFIATVNSILMQNAKPIFVDVLEDTFNINPDLIEDKITDKTKAIIAVDLYGHPADYKKINKIAKKYNLKVIEDACQSHGAEYYSKKTGNLADISAFSFYATKNITCGEGGALTTNNKNYDERSRIFRQHGQIKRYEYVELGYNYRLTDIQAAILRIQLKRLDKLNTIRRRNAMLYNKYLDKIKGITIPIEKKHVKHVYHQYTIKCDNKHIKRDKLMDYLNKNKIYAGIYYPKALHLFPHIKKFGYKKGDFPVAEKLTKQILSLPVHSLLDESDIIKVIKKIKEFSKSY